MNRAEHVHKLERECADQRLKASLQKAKQETRNETLNACINIQVAQMNYNIMALFYGALNTNKEEK